MTTKNNKAIFAPIIVIARVLLFYILSTILFIAATALTANVAPGLKDHLSVSLGIISALLLIVLFSRIENIKLKDTGVLPGRTSTPRFFCGYLIGLTMAFGQAFIVTGFGHVHLELNPHLSIIQILSFFILYVLVALREELVFRSYALTSLKKSLGPAVGLSIITVIFIIEHVASGMPLVTAIIGSGAGGFLFGYAALKTKGLALPLGLHSSWNFGQWMLGFKDRPGIWQAITDKLFTAHAQHTGMAAFAFVMLISIAGIHFYYKQSRKKIDQR
ncbi:MAG: lysostaphin resistance A-like protein [Mucilaginibacter sp.]